MPQEFTCELKNKLFTYDSCKRENSVFKIKLNKTFYAGDLEIQIGKIFNPKIS